jgi:hypothetical protein
VAQSRLLPSCQSTTTKTRTEERVQFHVCRFFFLLVYFSLTFVHDLVIIAIIIMIHYYSFPTYVSIVISYFYLSDAWVGRDSTLKLVTLADRTAACEHLDPLSHLQPWWEI